MSDYTQIVNDTEERCSPEFAASTISPGEVSIFTRYYYGSASATISTDKGRKLAEEILKACDEADRVTSVQENEK